MIQEVAALFEEIQSCSPIKAPAIGFYGIGGQGKTTICKLMVNHYAAAYAGRCTLIAFPSNDANQAHILNQCKKALQQLISISEGRVSRVDDLDECLQLLKDRVRSIHVFIVIDNVWENSLEYARRILNLGFSKDSKILVTSRSKKVLMSLLKDKRSVIRALPSVNKEEACQIFIKSFNDHADRAMNSRDVDDNIIKVYKFKEGYHPLAISALGVTLGRQDRGDGPWPTRCDEKFHYVDDKIDEVIKSNYDSIPKIRRELFLDVTLIFIPGRRDLVEEYRDPTIIRCHPYGSSTFKGRSFKIDTEGCDGLLIWLSALYRGKMDECEISRMLAELTYDGLLEFEDYVEGYRRVHVHDLYHDLATREAAASGRFYIVDEYNPSRRIVKDMKSAQVERICISLFKPGSNLPNLQLANLQLLIDVNVGSDDINGKLMPELRCLQLIRSNYNKRDRPFDWKRMPRLAWLDLHKLHCGSDISELNELLVLKLRQLMLDCRLLCLNRLVNLQILEIWDTEGIEEITGLCSLVHLKSIALMRVSQLLKVGAFSIRSTQLQILVADQCHLLESIEGLGVVPNLKVLWITECNCLRLPRLFNESLQSLYLVVKGAQPNLTGLTALRFLDLHCGMLNVAISGFPELRILRLRYGGGELSVDESLCTLEELIIDYCEGLKSINWGGLSKLTSLKRLIIEGCDELEKVEGDPGGITHTLRLLVIIRCPRLQEDSVAGLHLFTNCAIKVNDDSVERDLSPEDDIDCCNAM